MIGIILIIFTLLLLWINFIFGQWKYYGLSAKLKGPAAYPLIGCMVSFLGSAEENYLNLLNLSKKYSSPMCVWVGPKLYLYIDRPEQIQVVLNSPQCLDKEKVYKFIEEFGGEGLVTSDGIKWKYHRKLLNPCFGPKRLIAFMETFNDASKILANRLENYSIRKESVDIFNFLSDCTLDIVCKAAIGINLNLQESENSEYLNAVVNGFELACYRIFNFWLHPQWIYKWTKVFKKQQIYSHIMHAFPSSILKERKIEVAKDKKLRDAFLNEANGDEATKTPQIFINQLLKLAMQGHDLSDDDIQGELSTIILAANETSASALAYTILSLSFYPEIQKRVFDEINDVFPIGDCKVEFEDLAKLNYLEMVLKETMRFYTIIPIIGRRTSGEFLLGDLTIPAGVGIVIGCQMLHRHKDIWGDNADEFNPERFLPDAAEQRHPYSYIPFSAGPRNCIGQKYAMMSMKTIMVYLLRKYRFTTKLKPQELKYEIKVSLKLVNKHMIEVHARE